MRIRKCCYDISVNYGDFDDKWAGLATMILVQAAADANYLDGRDVTRWGGDLISRWEIVNFFRSKWAATLAEAVGLEANTLRDFEKRKFWQ